MRSLWRSMDRLEVGRVRWLPTLHCHMFAVGANEHRPRVRCMESLVADERVSRRDLKCEELWQ
jgi:hypothetical protein